MSNQVRFVMHPEDERVAIEHLLEERSVRLIDGPRWKTPSPELYRDLESIVGDYCIIWAEGDGAKMTAKPVQGGWYCDSENLSIQLLRSRLRGELITEGRFATGGGEGVTVPLAVRRRFKALRALVQSTYTNNLARWYNPDAPFLPATQGRSANPSAPDPRVWVELPGFSGHVAA